MSKVKVAVIGYGHLGKWHCQKVEVLKDLAEFVAIVEKFEPNQKLAKQNHPQVKVVSELSEVIHDIDAALIVTPTSTHASLVAQIVKEKKHIFCEKPVCSNDQEAKILSGLSTDGLVIQVGQSERFHQAWETLKQEIQKISSPFSLRINRYAPFKGRATDVDVIQDLGIHDLDLINFLFPDQIVSVQCQAFKIRTNHWDHAKIYLKLKNQSKVEIVLGRNHVKEQRELELISSHGTIVVDMFQLKISKAPSGQYDDGTFVKEESYEKRDHLLIEQKYFYESILNGSKAIVDLSQGLKAVHLVDLALKSAETGEELFV